MKPLWRDGLFMMPQHFQLFDQHHEELLDRRLTALEPNGYGIASMDLDGEALLRGLFRLKSLTAVLPDGLWVELGGDVALKELTVMTQGALVGGGKRSEVFLGVPSSAGRGTSTFLGEPGSRGARFVRSTRFATDAYGLAEETEVELVRPNAQLLLGSEDRSQYVTLKLCEIELSETGALVVSDSYVPPLLSIAASGWLSASLSKLVTTLGAKQSGLAARYRGRSTALVEFGPVDMVTFWYLQTINAALPRLLHLAQKGRVHPEQLYLALSELHGALATFEPSRASREVPPYVHGAPYASFAPLFTQLHEMAGLVLSQQYKSLPLEQLQPGLFVAQKLDPALLKKSQLYLVASGDVPEALLRKNVPQYVRISSYKRISDIVHAALPGMEVTVDLKPPSALPVKAENVYLKLGREGEHWHDILSTGTIAIFQPVKPQLVTLELLAVET